MNYSERLEPGHDLARPCSGGILPAKTISESLGAIQVAFRKTGLNVLLLAFEFPDPNFHSRRIF